MPFSKTENLAEISRKYTIPYHTLYWCGRSDKAMSFVRYPGGKSKLRDQITKRLAEQAEHCGLQYREPFFGGGSIGLKLLCDNPDITQIWINDKDIGIACLWTAVIRYPEEFKDRVLDFTPSVAAFHELRDELIGVSEMPKRRGKIVDIGFKKLAVHQMSYSGLGTTSGGPLGGEKQNSRYKIDCRWSPNYICKKVDILHTRFGAITVYDDGCTNLDFADLITDTRHDSLLYLDPPYFEKGNDLYQHGFDLKDHERLAEALRNTTHAWVLSYDDCPEVHELYDGWASVEPLDVKYSITATKDKETGERMSRTKAELLICSKTLNGVKCGEIKDVPACAC
jgi:DNA adenine methylase